MKNLPLFELFWDHLSEATSICTPATVYSGGGNITFEDGDRAMQSYHDRRALGVCLGDLAFSDYSQAVVTIQPKLRAAELRNLSQNALDEVLAKTKDLAQCLGLSMQ